MDWSLETKPKIDVTDPQFIPPNKRFDTTWEIIVLIPKIILFILLSLWAYTMLTQNPPWIFLDNANFFIHEIGHEIFTPLGSFMRVLGGSLFQNLVPLSMLCYFLLRRDWFASFFSLYWLGNNLISTSVYIGDARSKILPLYTLIGPSSGEHHDWNWLLTRVNLLEHDQTISFIVFSTGAVLAIVSLVAVALYIIKKIWNIIGNYYILPPPNGDKSS